MELRKQLTRRYLSKGTPSMPATQKSFSFPVTKTEKGKEVMSLEGDKPSSPAIINIISLTGECPCQKRDFITGNEN